MLPSRKCNQQLLRNHSLRTVITQSFSATRHHLSAIHVAPPVGVVLFVTMVLQIHPSPILKS